MNKIILIRHGKSIGNEENIIQGRRKEYPLTKEGKNDICLMVKKNFKKFSSAKKIIASDSIRSKQTAGIIAKNLNISVIEDKNVNEVNVGILEGLNKKIAEKLYPHYYEIWSNKGDLDEIPDAETGEELQARVIGFLMRYYGKKQFCDIVVSHAGFIRCLINTIKFRERTFQFNIDNNSVFEIEDIFGKMICEKRDRAMNSKVFICDTYDEKYVVKIKHGLPKIEDYAEQCLLNHMQGDNVPKIFSIQSYDDENFCKVIKHVKGKHVYGRLNSQEYDALIKSEHELEKILKGVSGTQFFKSNNLKERISDIYKGTNNLYTKNIAEKLLKSKYCSDLANIKDYVLSHDDLNRDNILFEDINGTNIRANIIDFESLELAPKDYQFASMLASGLLLEGESMKKIKSTIKERGKDVEKILFFMQIRTLEGLYFFQNKIKDENNQNKETSKELLKKYFFNSEVIKNEIYSVRRNKEIEG